MWAQARIPGSVRAVGNGGQGQRPRNTDLQEKEKPFQAETEQKVEWLETSRVGVWSAGSHAAGRATGQGSWISQQRPLVTLSRALSWSGGWSQTVVEEQVTQRKGNEG